jgi:hypothetical protein
MTDEQSNEYREFLERCFRQAAEHRKRMVGLPWPDSKTIFGYDVLWPGDTLHKRRDGKYQVTRVQELN